MLKQLRTLRQIISTLRSGKNVGDVAILKLTLFNDSEGPSPHTDQVMALKDLTFLPLEISSLETLPPDTFGYAFADFMRRNRLRPFNFSEDISGQFARFPVSTRYARIHDMVHTLLGFEATLAGELGVYAFIEQQNYTLFLQKGYRAGRWVTRALKPWALNEFRDAEVRGRQLAQNAKFLISERLEDRLEESLDSVRHDLVPSYFSPFEIRLSADLQ